MGGMAGAMLNDEVTALPAASAIVSAESSNVYVDATYHQLCAVDCRAKGCVAS